MNWVLVSIFLASGFQWGICGFSIPLLLALIGRVCFMSRIVGAYINSKVSKGFEIAACLVIVVGMIFTKSPINWINTLIFFGLCLASVGLMYIDDKLYLYVIEDEEDED